MPRALAEITAQLLPVRRFRSCPRALKRYKPRKYRTRRRGEAPSVRYDKPPTIHLYALQPS